MKISKWHLDLQKLSLTGAILILWSLISAPAFAHHPLDGRLPANFFEGIMSGFGHPILGLDHLAFVVAIGLMAFGLTQGFLVPIAFVLATGIGAGIHLAAIDLPIPELIIAASVVLSGIFLLVKGRNQTGLNYTKLVAAFVGFAGLFHGFAYGEGIFGAEATPLVAYLIGFTLIQLVISLIAYGFASRLSRVISTQNLARFVGAAIAVIGLSFLSSAVFG